MKKLFILSTFIGLCSLSASAQTSQQDSCADLRAMYDQAVYFLDSLLGDHHKLQRQLDTLRRNNNKSKAEINNVLKDKAETQSALKEAKKLIADQAAHINKLDAEVKRLSTPAKPKEAKKAN